MRKDQAMKTKYRPYITALLIICMVITMFPVPATAAQSGNLSETISSAADLSKLRADPDGNFVLTTDLVLSGDFTPIANFSGILDGQGHMISNLSITATSSQPSVAFIISNGGTIKNLGFIDVTVTGISTSKTNWAAAIATQNTGTIESCYVKGTVSGGYRSAGICAHNFGTIKNCYAIVNLSAKVECGEID